MLMRVQMNDASRSNDYGERHEASNDSKLSSDFLTRRLDHMHMSVPLRLLGGGLGQHQTAADQVNPHVFSSSTVDRTSSAMEGTTWPPGARHFSMSNEHYRSSPAPHVSLLGMNSTTLTNTLPSFPMHYPDESALLSSGVLRFESGPSCFPSTSMGVSSESGKTTGKEKHEIDMNLPFPVKLHYILSNPNYQKYIAWLPHGRSWRILKPEAFEAEVIPRIFRSAKIASFMRQVNGWAFTRTTEGQDLNAYYHELFLRGLPELSLKMKRPPKGKNAASAARNAAGAGRGTPDFYRIAKIAPLPSAAPFKPVVKDSTTGSESSSLAATPRYVIQPLFHETKETGRQGIVDDPLLVDDLTFVADWLAEDDSRLPDVELDDPFVDESEFVANNVRSRPMGDQQGAGGVGGSISTPANSAAKDIYDQLSKADIRYLAHQNQILLSHLQNDGRHSEEDPSLPPSAAEEDEDDHNSSLS